MGGDGAARLVYAAPYVHKGAPNTGSLAPPNTRAHARAHTPRQVDAVDKPNLIRALEVRRIKAPPMTARRWLHVDLIRHWATTFLPPEARFAREAELSWLAEVEEMGGCVLLEGRRPRAYLRALATCADVCVRAMWQCV